MKFTISTEIWAGILLACTGGNTFADLKDNPYRMISAHNAFALRPIPAEKVIEKIPEPAPPAVEILLTGVTTLLNGSPLAFLEFFDPQTKKTDRPSPFREGDRYNERIQIVSIDAALGLVRISKDGSELTLDFEKNGIKPEPSTQPSGQPRPPVASVPLPFSAGGRLISNIGLTNIPTGTPPVTMTREEVLARLRSRLPPQNPSVANILPPPPMGRSPD